MLILGIGPFVANFVCGKLKEAHAVGKSVDYHAVFQYSMGAALVAAVLLLLLFHPPKAGSPEIDKPEEQAPPVA